MGQQVEPGLGTENRGSQKTGWMPRVETWRALVGRVLEWLGFPEVDRRQQLEGSLRLCAHLCPDLQLHFLPFLFPECLRVEVLAGVFVVIAALPHT